MVEQLPEGGPPGWKAWVVIICLVLLGTVLASACEIRELDGTFQGYRVLVDGTKLAVVRDRYCPISAVRLTPSVQVGDMVTITNFRACGSTLDKFEEGGPPDDIRRASPESTSN